MSKVGRNEPCPCGSGKKYKKCCLGKLDVALNDNPALAKFLSYEEIDQLSTTEIIQKLNDMNVAFSQEAFLEDIPKYNSAEDISKKWFTDFEVSAKGRDEDFPWFAAWVLWERLAPENMMPLERIDVLIDEGYNLTDEGNYTKACDVFLEVWEAIKLKHNPQYKNMKYMDKQFRGSFFVENLVQDIEGFLYNAGLDDKVYFEKRIMFCKEFLECFPEEEELNTHNMRRAIADSYVFLDDIDQADREFEKLVEDYPNNPWGYIGWGDAYFLGQSRDYAKAKMLYEKALTFANDPYDVEAVQERMEDLEKIE